MISCGGPRSGRWCSGLLLWIEGVDNDEPPTATRARDGKCSGLIIGAFGMIQFWYFSPEQYPNRGDIGGTVAISEV